MNSGSKPQPPRPLPRLMLNPAVDDLFAFTYDDIVIENYDPLPAIKAPVAGAAMGLITDPKVRPSGGN